MRTGHESPLDEELYTNVARFEHRFKAKWAFRVLDLRFRIIFSLMGGQMDRALKRATRIQPLTNRTRKQNNDNGFSGRGCRCIRVDGFDLPCTEPPLVFVSTSIKCTRQRLAVDRPSIGSRWASRGRIFACRPAFGRDVRKCRIMDIAWIFNLSGRRYDCPINLVVFRTWS
mmetsp:Transcript_15018/g.36946  ORF Transcript_15018/g.36946 Transcript_15018/m.36946 type:complete len:171 (-) Transcript_15018:4265-4777(-)